LPKEIKIVYQLSIFLIILQIRNLKSLEEYFKKILMVGKNWEN